MFKAKLIEDDSYYKFRSKQLLLMLLPAMVIGGVVNVFQAPIWLTLTMVGIYLLIMALAKKNQNRLNAALGGSILEIDEQEIRIRSNKGNLPEVIRLDEIENVFLKEAYSIPQETMKDIGNELTGKPKKNYLIIEYRNSKRRFDFEVDSYYMITQLNKLIENWKAKGVSMEQVNA